MKIILSILCSALLLLACKKEKNTTFITGFITDTVRNAKAQNVRVQVTRCGIEGSSVKCLDEMESALSNSEGAYQIQFDRPIRLWGYEFSLDAADDFYYTNAGPYVLNQGEKNIIDFSVVKYSVLKLHLKIDQSVFGPVQVIGRNMGTTIHSNSIDTTLFLKILPNNFEAITFRTYDSTAAKYRNMIEQLPTNLNDTIFLQKHYTTTVDWQF